MRTLLLAGITLLASATVAYGATPSSTNAPATTPADAAAENQNQRGPEQTPVFVKGNYISPQTLAEGPEQRTIEAIKSANEHTMTVATVWIAGLTGLMLLVAGGQLWMFFKQLKLTQDAVSAGAVAAYAAKASAEALPKIERAYLFVEVLLNRAIEFDKDSGAYWAEMLVRITNHGKTPAILTRFRAYADFLDVAPRQLINHDRANNPIPHGLVIGSTLRHIEKIQRMLTVDEYASFSSAAGKLYAVGLVEYDDVLKDRRTTGFCWQSSYPADFIIAPVQELNYYT
jgi:hypothetical protein